MSAVGEMPITFTFFSSSPVRKTLAALSFQHPIIPFWLETHNQIWSLIDGFYQVTPCNSFVAREVFFKLTCAVIKLPWKVILSWFLADHKSKMHLTFFRPHYLAFCRDCNSNLLTFCWSWATLMVFLEQKPLTVTETTDNRSTVSLWEAISVGFRRRNQMKVLKKKVQNDD